jgi:hypothetical protein
MAQEQKAGKTETPELDVGQPAAPTVNWDDSAMSTSYANVVNAASTREEVTLFFGTNQTWNPVGKTEFEVRLTDRIVVSPFAAKRLWTLMGAVLQEYEKRFGSLDLGLAGNPPGTGNTGEKKSPSEKN